MKGNAWTAVTMLLLLLPLTIPPIGCGGATAIEPSEEGPGPGNTNDDPCAPFDLGLSGTWDVTETEVSNSCGDPWDPPYESEYVILIAQDGRSLTLTEPSDGEWVVTQLCGHDFSVPAEQMVDGEVVIDFSVVAFTFSSATSFSGTYTQTWTYPGGEVCVETRQIASTKR